MKKLTIISAITTLVIIITSTILIVFQTPIITSLVKNNHLKIASMLYTPSKVKNKILELDYISINTSVDKSIFDKTLWQKRCKQQRTR